MSISLKSITEPAASEIAAVREACIVGMNICDFKRLEDVVTDDVVVVYGDGSCVCGKEELMASVSKNNARFDTEDKVSLAKVIVRDKWAFEIDEVERTVTSVRGGVQVHIHLKTVVVFAMQSDASWKVARILELFD